MSEALQLNPIPIEGRFVSGDIDKIRTTDHEMKQKSRSKHQYEFGVAFPKQAFAEWMQTQMYPYLSTAWAQFPDNIARLNKWWGQPGLQGKYGGCSLKISDGDKPNAKGNVNTHTVGHYVVYFTSFGSGYAPEDPHPAEPPLCYAGKTADALVQIDMSQVKRGDYVVVSGSMSPNGKTGDQVGAFMNCTKMWKLRDGEAIIGDADPSGSFGGTGLTGSFNPAGAETGQAFGGAPAGNPPAPGTPPTDHVGTQAQGGTPPNVPGGTVSPGNPMDNTTPHTDILSQGQPPASGETPAPGAAPGLPGM